MLNDVQIARLAEHGGPRWWLFIAKAYAGLVVEWLPIVLTLKRYGELKHKAEAYDIAFNAWEEVRKQNYELRRRLGDDCG